jgi:hypothetical protein
MAEAEKIRSGRLLQLSKVYAGHHPDNHASENILKKLGFEFIENVFYEPTGLMHPSYVCKAPAPPHRFRGISS